MALSCSTRGGHIILADPEDQSQRSRDDIAQKNRAQLLSGRAPKPAISLPKGFVLGVPVFAVSGVGGHIRSSEARRGFSVTFT